MIAWSSNPAPGGKHNQKASKTTHTHQAWIHTSNLPRGLVWFLDVQRQNIKTSGKKKKKKQQNWAFNNHTILKCKENSQWWTKHYHLSCLPWINFSSQVKDTVANRKGYPHLDAFQDVFLYSEPLLLVSNFKWNWYMARLTPLHRADFLNKAFYIKF